MASSSKIAQCREWFEDQLEKSVDFWLSHSIDHRHGGFYDCLSENGELYDTFKHGWMQGRQVWMLSKLYNDEPRYHRPDILDAAIKGGNFLLDFFKVKNENRCYFSVTEDGQPVSLQRKPYTECFYVMGLSELYRACNDVKYQVAAEEMLEQFIQWVCVDDSGLGRPRLSGAPSTRELGRPMMLLNILIEFCGDSKELRGKYMEQIEWSVQSIKSHFDGSWIREHVLTDGTGFPEGSMGRQTTPGHAIEAGWFLLKEANIRNDDQLRQIAIKNFMETPLSYGWDKEFGGLYYFLDTGGHCPVPLEWCMKLWWPHCEALIAFLMAYSTTKDPKHWDMFMQCFEYTSSRFPDDKNGEWYGYLDRRGNVTHTLKGSAYKGFFHVPRCLFICQQLLQKLVPNEASSHDHTV